MADLRNIEEDFEQSLGEIMIIDIEDGCSRDRSFVASMSQLMSLASNEEDQIKEFTYIDLYETELKMAENLTRDILHGRVINLEMPKAAESDEFVDYFYEIDGTPDFKPELDSDDAL